MKLLLTIGCISLLMASCQQSPKINARSGNIGIDSGRQAADVSLSISNDHEFDAYDYTFGVSQITLGASGSVKTTLSALASKNDLSDQEKDFLSALCSDIAIGTSADSPSESVELEANQPLFIFWRSHYPANIKAGLGDVFPTGRVHCSLGLEIGSKKVDVVFNPTPSAIGRVAGTSKGEDALDEVLMLIDTSATGTVLKENHGYQVIDISTPGEILLGIEGLHSGDIQVAAQDSETTCRYHTLNGETKLGNPTELQSFTYGLTGPSDITVSDVFSTSSGGRSLEACSTAETETLDSGFAVGIPCAEYMEIQEKGAGDTCGWSAGVANNNDPKNSVAIGLRMSSIELDTIDIGNPEGAVKAIVKSDKNPIALDTLDVTTFSDPQTTALERAFDFWLGASPVSYDTYWAGNINKITYLGNTDACAQQGVLAFVTSLDTDEIFWCELAGVRQQDLTEQRSPLVLMLIAVTALHENLHAVGREHDFDAPNYDACKGTAESGVLSYDTVMNCEADACFAMKDLAIQEYIVELDYSLQGDGRRFQGLCAQWNADLGLTQANFGT